MTLKDAILNIQYDSNWGIWATAPFTPESEARYGQRMFSYGGVNDGKAYFDHGANIGDYLANYVGNHDEYETEEDLKWAYEEAAEDLVYSVAMYFEQ